MAGPGGKEVGRVSVRVVPNTARFRDDLKKALSRIEKTATVSASVKLDTEKAHKDFEDFKKSIDGEQLRVDIEAATAAARVAVRRFVRPRVLPVHVEVTPSSLARAGAAIAALSGARVAADYLQRMKDQLLELDRAIPTLAGVASAIAALSSLAISSAGGLFTVGAGLAQAAAAAAALPGIMAGAAAGVGVLVVALTGAKEYVGDLAEGWKALGGIIRENFWAQAEESIRGLSEAVLPSLRTELAGTAKALGDWTASLADAFGSEFTPEVFASMFGNLNESIRIASTATGNFASIMSGLGQVGASYLPRLATWVADLTTRFDDFIARAIESGDIFTWVENGITAFKQIGSVLASLGGIFAGINSAAQAAGGGGLATLASVMSRINEVVNGPVFQGALTTIFEGAAAGARGLGDALVPIGNMIATLAPAISGALGTLGGVIGEVASTIAEALGTQEFGAALSAVVHGLAAGFKALMPAIEPLAGVLAEVMKTVGPLAGVIGSVLSVALQALAPLITTILQAIQPLIPILGQALVGAVQALAPLFQVLGQVIQTLAPFIAQLVGMLAPFIGQVLATIVPIITSVVQALMPIVQALLPPLLQILQALLPVILPLIQVALIPFVKVMELLSPILSVVANIISAVLVPVIQLLSKVLSTILNFIVGAFTGQWSSAWEGIGKFFSDIWDGIVSFVKSAIQTVQRIIVAVVMTINTVWNAIWGGISSFFGGIWNGIVNTVKKFSSIFKSVFGGIKGIVTNAFKGVIGIVKGPINGIIGIINNAIDALNGLSVTIPDWVPFVGGQTWGLSLPKIPYLATGGIVTDATVAVVGEGRYDEAVVPLGGPQMARLAAAVASRVAESGSARPTQVIQNITTQQDDPVVQMRQWGREASRGLATV